MRTGFDRVKRAVDRELLAEEFGRSLRRLWLEATLESTSRNFRSPPIEQTTTTATGRKIEFGYEKLVAGTRRLRQKRCAKHG
jgi:hypothetical protein